MPPSELDHRSATKDWYELSYSNLKDSAQRRYPNEELVRFVERTLKTKGIPFSQVSVLEVGSGGCGNLWMLAREGFNTFGIDISEESIAIGNQALANWQTTAELKQGSMTKLPFADKSIDAVVDVFSSCCLVVADFDEFLTEAHRVLKPNGNLFIHNPSVNSDAYRNYHPAEKIDEHTLNGIYRVDSPFYGNFYPFRFLDPETISEQLLAHGFRVTRLETTSRSYNHRQESFELLSIDAEKETR